MRVGTDLNVPAPGVLGNDLFGIATNLTAILVGGPTNGSLKLDTNGGFAYAPLPGYAGMDSFTYQAVDPVGNASLATVSIVVSPTDTFFADDFTRATNPYLNCALGNSICKLDNHQRHFAGRHQRPQHLRLCVCHQQLHQLRSSGSRKIPAGAFGGGLGGRLGSANRKTVRRLGISGRFGRRFQYSQTFEVPKLDDIHRLTADQSFFGRHELAHRKAGIPRQQNFSLFRHEPAHKLHGRTSLLSQWRYQPRYVDLSNALYYVGRRCRRQAFSHGSKLRRRRRHAVERRSARRARQ